MEPTISIIIPTFNRAALLPHTLRSIAAQTYDHWECIVVDDGSQDHTAQLMQDFAQQDARFRYFKRPEDRPKGANACRNYGFEQARGVFVNWFDSDDLMYPQFLANKLAVLEANPALDFCACIQETFRDNAPEIREVVAPEKFSADRFEEDLLLNGLYFYTPSPLWRKQFLDGKALFDESLSRSQEADFHFRMLSYHPNFTYLREVLYGIRTGNPSISSGATLSLAAQQSVFEYFWRAFRVLVQNGSYEAPIKRYVFFRLAVNFYNQNTLAVSLAARRRLLLNYYKKLQYCAAHAQLPWTSRLKLGVGFLVVWLTGKGYVFFYFPQYAHRKTGKQTS